MYIKMMKSLIILILLLPIHAMADSFSISLENDIINSTDQAYTHGTKFSKLKNDVPSCLDSIFPDRATYINYIYAQYMYTSTDISVETLMENDRPYGGWLYCGYSFSAYTPTRLDSFEIDLGVTGEWSGAEQVQKTVHDIFNNREPKGWDNQLGEEVGIDLIWQEKLKFRMSKYFDIIPHYGTALGTIHTFFNVGGMLRAGYNLPDDYGPLMSEPVNRELSDWYVYAFTAVDGRYVARNFFLDGNLFKDSHSVPKEAFVTDLVSGVSLSFNDFEIVYAYTIRSKEHKWQEDHNEFGSLILSWKY